MTKTTPKVILKSHIQKTYDDTKTKLNELANKQRLKKLINKERLVKLTDKEIVDDLIYQVNKYKKDKALFFLMGKLIDNNVIKVDNNPRFIKLIEKDKKIDESVVTDTIDTIISYERSSECRSDTLHKSTNNVVGEVINGNEQINDTPSRVIKVQDIINYAIDNVTLYQKGSIDL